MAAPQDRLAAVAAAAKHDAAARKALHTAIRHAAKNHSLRQVAHAAGLSHEQVRRIVNRVV